MNLQEIFGKFKSKQAGDLGSKSSDYPLGSYNSGNYRWSDNHYIVYSANTRFKKSTSVQSRKIQSDGLVNSDRNDKCDFSRKFQFFIQWSDDGNKERRDHYNRLKDKVFRKLADYKLEHVSIVNGYKDSFEGLYVTTLDGIENTEGFPQAKAHLRSYEEDALYDTIKKRINDHNKKASEFARGIQEKVKNSIELPRTNGALKIRTTDIHEFSGKFDDLPFYHMSNVMEYLRKRAKGSEATLVIDSTKPNEKTALYLNNNACVVAEGKKETLEFLNHRIEKQYSDVRSELAELLKEGEEIINSYNNEFAPEIKNLILEIEDGKLKGRCDSPHCKSIFG